MSEKRGEGKGGGGGKRRKKKKERMIFFFKQKTAYEIKECDWSSDVCSSDLVFSKEKKINNFYYSSCNYNSPTSFMLSKLCKALCQSNRL